MEILSLHNKPEIFRELLAFLENWCAINGEMDANAMVSLYHETAILLGTFANKPCVTPRQISDYFSELFGGGKIRFGVHVTEKLIYEQNGILFTTGEYLFSWQQNNTKIEVPARFTFILSKENDNWKIFHHHSSILPDNYYVIKNKAI